ncbi:MAG: FHA domain-containing protein [Candidatus Sericytochromatia bacterium]|nr:FHA domain-containing protein [Candidatus Tanganyikabacteria bacterium]
MSAELICPVCGFGNRPGATVCEDCGLLIPQYQACPTCGFMNTADSRFCGNCGSELGFEKKFSGGPSRLKGPAAPVTAPAPPPDPPAHSLQPPSMIPQPPPSAAQPASAPPQASAASPAGAAPPATWSPSPAPPVFEDFAGRVPPKAGPTFRLVHEGTGVEIRLPLADAALVVGRPGGGPDVDVSGFPESSVVSRKHARLLVSDGEVRLEDLGSANGTYVNNVRVRAETDLADGDRIAFGQGAKVVFTFRLS